MLGNRNVVPHIVLSLASAIIWSYLISVVAVVTPSICRVAFGAQTTSDLHALLPSATVLALSNVWLFVVFIWLSVLVFCLCLRRCAYHAGALCVATVSIHMLVAWLAGFCFFEVAVQGDMCLHSLSRFSPQAFISIFHGIFPVTLMAILAALAVSVASIKKGAGTVNRE